MNNKGFTLIEILITIAIIGLVTIITISIVQETLAIGDEKTYDLMKKNIITSTNTYLSECSNNLIECTGEYTWKDNKTTFPVNNLIKHGYFYYDNLINPLTKKNISNCLLIEVTKDEYQVYIININESEC